MTIPTDFQVAELALAALAEDGDRDLTSDMTVEPGLPADARIEFRSGGVLAGASYADAVARACDCAIGWHVADGDEVAAGAVVGTLNGPLAGVLRAERSLLNLLQRASGIATATRAYVHAVTGTGCRILHTRKTAPALRVLDVAGVVAGGGGVHRLDLSHAVMVKDNHWQALARGGRTLADALARARAAGVQALYVEVETPAQLDEACAAGATRLLIDNQTPAMVRAWGAEARRHSPGIEIEATGGITLDNVRAYAESGADYISIGALTHSVRAADLAVEVRF